ncbi:MAG: NAD(P)-dependent alcohol dehydrogenase [Alphaproteobacteria bacterium]|nr:NAD(P)-dependent alcohol dehydrogenase [Alphaproteobacteria bacterium]
MQAAQNTSYGSPDVLTVQEIEAPALGDHDVLIRVHASPVTQGDRRLRAADFPGIGWLPGRLMTGLLRPRHRTPGTAFAGRVEAVGAAVTRFTPGQDVFGAPPHGAQAELLVMPEDGALAAMPRGFSDDEAAALPYGGVTAMVFLRELGEVRPGQRVLIVGAAGGVGRLAVQLAAHLGAEVTGVASARDHDLLRALGAHHVIDRRTRDFAAEGQRYDVIFDASTTVSFGRARAALAPEGRFLTLHMGVGVLAWMAVTALVGGQRAIFGVALGDAARLEQVRVLAEAGAFRPVIARRFPLAEVAAAHAYLEGERPHGSVVVTLPAAGRGAVAAS